MPQLNNILLWLCRKLFPNGRAFNMPLPVETGSYITDEAGNNVTDEAGNFLVTEDFSSNGGHLYRLMRALGIQFAIAWTAARGVSDAQLPDNLNFTLDDCNDWYRRLGIYNSGLLTRSQMIAGITQWWNHNNPPINCQNYLYIQNQLQLAGFNVNVYENRFPLGGTYITKTISEVLGEPVGNSVYGGIVYGEAVYGGTYSLDGVTICANYLEDASDASVVVTNWRSTFYIADPSGITTFATIPAARHIEFRQLLIKLKPIHTIGILFVNYV